MDILTINAISSLIEMIKTADRAMNREDQGTEGYTYYHGKKSDLECTLKRMVNNAIND